MVFPLSANASRIFVAATAIAALSQVGCGLVTSGPHDAMTEFLVSPQATGKFFGWSEIKISQDANSVSGATLKFARLELPDDSPAEDLTFIHDIYAQLVIRDDAGELLEAQPVAQKDPMPEGEVIVPLDIVYDGDLRHFFPDGHTIRMEWTGNIDPTVTIPPEGYWVDVRIRVIVE